MDIGHKIYFDKTTGVIVQHIYENSGGWNFETTREQDFEDFKTLSERNPETVSLIQLDYGQFAQEFAACNGYRVNPNTMELEFSYPDPSDPEKPKVYYKPLSEQINENTEYLVDVDYRLSLVELGLK